MNPAPALPLRDIHLPEPLSWWPPAPGWWALAAALVLVALAVHLLYRRYRRRALSRAARRALEQVFAAYAEGRDARVLLSELSLVLRRSSLSHFPRREVAGLTGEAWLRFLDQSLEPARLGRGFSEGPGRILASGPYAPQPDVDADALRSLCYAWAQGLEKGSGR